MVALSRVLGLACLVGVEGARIARKRGATKTIAGVPIHKYHAAYGGESVVETEREEEWIVVVSKTTSDAEIERICARSKNSCSRMGHPSKGGVPFLETRGTEKDLEAVIRSAGGVVEFVEPDTMDHIIPEMPDIEGEAPEVASWGLDRVGVPDRATTGKGVHIYVQDTGVRSSHTDFDGRVVPTLDLTNVKEICNGDTSCAADRHGHGTHCAGTAAGRTYGVASGATVHAVKTLGDYGSGARSDQISALDWMTINAEKPAVVSMSLGGLGADSSYTVAIDAATEAGLTVVVAAGNDNMDSCYYSPAFAENAITVGATSTSNKRASFSNYGECNDIFAPGSLITSAGIRDDGSKAMLSGTSMACPHVSGGAALLLEANPTLTRNKILDKMAEAARKGFVGDIRGGDPDIFLWVGASPAPEPAPTPAPPTPAPANCKAWCGPHHCATSSCSGCSYC